jgi:CBS-domain-containing membrane protein
MQVKELMVPVSDYPRVAEDRSVFDAFNILEAHRKRFARKEYRPRVVLVHDADFNLIGGLDHTGMMRVIGGTHKPEWDKALASLGEAARSGLVKDAMTRYGKEDHIEEDASLAEAVPKLIHSKLHNLVVTAQGTTVGILRMSDVFNLVMNGVIRPLK